MHFIALSEIKLYNMFNNLSKCSKLFSYFYDKGVAAMSYIYRLNELLITGADGKEHIVYGIEAIDSDLRILLSIHDIFFEKQKASDFVNLCNQCGLSLIHLKDVAEDFLAAQYSVL